MKKSKVRCAVWWKLTWWGGLADKQTHSVQYSPLQTEQRDWLCYIMMALYSVDLSRKILADQESLFHFLRFLCISSKHHRGAMLHTASSIWHLQQFFLNRDKNPSPLCSNLNTLALQQSSSETFQQTPSDALLVPPVVLTRTWIIDYVKNIDEERVEALFM